MSFHFNDKTENVFQQVKRDTTARIKREIQPTVASYVYHNSPVVTGKLRDSGEPQLDDMGSRIKFTYGSTSGYGRYVNRYLAVLGRAVSIAASVLRR